MDILTLLNPISKIAIGAFVVTLGIVIYEIFLMFKSGSGEAEKVKIPDFKEGQKATESKVLSTNLPLPPTEKQLSQREIIKKRLIWFLALLGIFGIIGLGGFLYYRFVLPQEKFSDVGAPLPTNIPEKLSPTNGEKKAQQPSLIPTAFPTSFTTPSDDEENQVRIISPTLSVSVSPTKTVTTTVTKSISGSPTVTPPSQLPKSGMWQNIAIIAAGSILLILVAFVI